MDILFTLSTSDPETANNMDTLISYIMCFNYSLFCRFLSLKFLNGILTMRVQELSRNSISYPRQRTSTDG